MIVSVRGNIENKTITKELGIVYGNIVRSRIFYRDFVAGIRMFLGLEVKEYSSMMARARTEAIERMKKEAQNLGANAVLNVRLVTTATSLSTAELLAYGDAVTLNDN